MYRLILVDDEAIIREGISRCVPWGQNGFELVGLFEHGGQALDYLDDHPVDIVITDINMPRMDGLTLSKILAEKYPRVMVLLLSGYDDFEYAQEALKNQVRDFLLKPITAEELKDVLLRVHIELDQSREQEHQQEIMKDRLDASFPLLRERFLYRLISGRLSRENFLRRREYFQWTDLCSYYQISVISIPESWDDLETITLSENLKSNLPAEDEVFFNREEDIVILLQGKDQKKLADRALKVAEQAFIHISRLDIEQISAGCGEVVESPFLLQNSYRGACTALDYSKVLGLSQVISINEVRDRKRISLEGFNTISQELTRALRTGSSDSAETALANIFTFFEEHYLTMSEASGYLVRLHFLLVQFINEMELVSPSEHEPLFEPPGSFGSLQQARYYFFRVLEKIEEIVLSRRHDAVLSRIDRARRLIAERYGDSSFSLNDVCDELYLSTSQFSMLFKEGTGQTFVEYLTAQRIEEAKKLLKTTDLKGYEIAEKTGFADPRYFSIVFKKITGLTAMEYRKRVER
ncbi:MAG: response regulator [Spirochaetales bacterium]|nr:response regulator [Spirochaetales bacterium]